MSVRDVEVGLGVVEPLSQAKVNDIDLVSLFPNTHQEVVGLDVTVDKVVKMDVLDAGNLQYQKMNSK